MRLNYLLSLLVLLKFASVYSQSGKLFSVDKELSSSLIQHVYQDHNGVIWIATADGLNRYDGSKFTVYKKNNHDSTSLLNNYVRIIFEDSRKNLLVGFINGLQRYDHATDTFKEIPLILEDGNKFPAHVMSIMERRNGDILIATSGHGVFLLNANGDMTHANQITSLMPSYLVGHLYEDKNGNLWISTQDKGLFRLGKDQQLKNYFPSEENGNIFSLCEDNKGNLYAGSPATGLYAYNRKSDSFHAVPLGDYFRLAINKLYRSYDGDILIGTEGSGMKIFDPVRKKISEGNFGIETFDFSKSKVNSIMEDKTGNIWLGIFQKGVMLLPAKTNNFRYYGYKSIKNNIIGSHNVVSVYKDHEGTLWVGTDGDGLYGVGPCGEQKAHFTHTSLTTVPSTIFSIYEDSYNNLWLGSYDRGLAKMNPKTGHCEYVNEALKNSITQVPKIFGIMEDKQNNLWIGTMGSGLYCLNPVTRDVTHYYAPNGIDYRYDANMLHNNWINCVVLTSNEKLYIGTFDGLGCLDLKKRNFASTYGTNRLLPGNIVYTVYEDPQGILWIGTSDGLIAMDTASQKTTLYTMDDGLPNNVICAINGDTLNNLWISTNYGISKMNLESKSFINYYSDDGLQGNEFSKGTTYVDKDGEIIFGGINGITLFKPHEITDQGKKLEVHITGFYLHNQAVRQGMKSGSYEIITSSVMDAEVFNLSHSDNSFTIEFSAMEFNNPERITYMYSLRGDEDWIILRPGTNNVTFNNLSPGEYSFRVKAKDYNTYSDVKKISVIVHPAWYSSIWAKLIYGFTLVMIAYIIIQQARLRYRTRQKMQEHMHAKRINEAKLQFFINIAHEIRTPMTLIISPLKKLMNKDRDRERQRAYFMMNRNSERILHLINQLMDIQKIDKGQMRLMFQETEIVEFIHDLCYVFDEQTQAKQIELLYLHEMEKLNAWVDPNNFDKVILNVLSNALKFTPPGGKISVHLSIGKDENASRPELQSYFQVIVSDSGIGISQGELVKVFECFYQARESKHSFSEGTGIGLHLTRSIVELHHGIIWAENNIEGPGCRFIIRLPLGNDHLSPDQIQNNLAPDYKPEQFSHVLPSPLVDLPGVKIKSKSKHRVLVVEDDKEIRQYVCDELAPHYHMAECADGKEALSMVLKNNPDIIISDIMMPEMDGITLCRKIKQNVNINHIPVILLTAKSEEEDTLEGLGIGADAYIVKPFNIEVLKKTVENIIRNREILKNNYSGSQQQKDKVQSVAIASPDEKLLKRIMDTINKNIANTELNVEMLSHEIGISRVHLHRKLKELTNQSTRDLIRNIRLQQAANLLSEKQLNISEVAFAVGFTNVAHFSNAFKELYGMSPTTYMETRLKETGKSP